VPFLSDLQKQILWNDVNTYWRSYRLDTVASLANKLATVASLANKLATVASLANKLATVASLANELAAVEVEVYIHLGWNH
jgi:Lon protease-like protein